MKQIVVIDSFLVWFDTQSDKKPKGIVRMDEARSEVCDLSVIGKQFGMKVTTTKTQREYFFSTQQFVRSARKYLLTLTFHTKREDLFCS